MTISSATRHRIVPSVAAALVLDDDRALYRDIETARDLLASGEIVSAVEQRIGPLE